MDSSKWMENYQSATGLATILKINQKTQAFGLSLTPQDAQLLLAERCDSLKEVQRVEFGEGILSKLIMTFCDSPYIYQSNYVETIGRLQDIFYQYKNELPESFSDDELLAVMEKEFNGKCEGSPDYLEETILSRISQEIRIGGETFLRQSRRMRDVEDDV